MQGINAVSLLFLVVLGFAPALIWLAFYLREDTRPEPNRLILLVFLAGIVSAFAAAIIETNLACTLLGERCVRTLGGFTINSYELGGIAAFLFAFAGVAVVEEAVKYGAVFFTVLHNRSFDEPIDAMIYLIIAALGFATVENIFTVQALVAQGRDFSHVLSVLTLRFLGATFLHTLASGIVGYALARAFFAQRSHFIMVIPGIAIAGAIHALYNMFVSRSADVGTGHPLFSYFFVSIIILLVGSALALIALFHHLKHIGQTHTFVNLGDHAQQN